MKVVLALAALCGLIALCSGEDCQPGTHCQHVTCTGSGYTLECLHGQCTCTHSASCISKADCHAVDGCIPNDWHCVDSLCRCGMHAPQGPPQGPPGNNPVGK